MTVAVVRWYCPLGRQDHWTWSAGYWLRPRTMAIGLLLLLVLAISATLASTTRIQHSRQLHFKTPHRMNLGLLKQHNSQNHNHKPVFANCSHYAPLLKEETLPGTLVIQVQAEDEDLLEEGGTITYSFVRANGEKHNFDINNQTGLIRTTHAYDRDEPAREKEVYLTVLATDNGRPQLNDVCTFKVTIEDINDNAPIFDKISYLESVPRNLWVGREVMRISATDIDGGANSKVHYSMSPKHLADSNYFRIDLDTGVIFLNQTIDKAPGYRFSMRAMARDQGDEPKQSVIDVDIRVVESNKKAPSITYCPDQVIKLPEDFGDYKAPIARLEAASNVDGSPDYLLFELVTGGAEQSNKYNTFRLVSNKNSAEIKLAKYLDYEGNSEYSLIVRVQNKFRLAVETTIHIEVLDVNDNIPTFRKMENGSVLEHEPPGTSVMQARAIDADGTSAHNQVTYALDNCDTYFTIDRYTGIITTLVEFDRELDDTFTVKVIATDNSPSALFETGEHNKGEQNFCIEIVDKNDNPPLFIQREYTVNALPEDANINALVTEVKALDADTTGPVIYSLVLGNLDDSFMIENRTGRIRVDRRLDYEKIDHFNLTVRAFDGVFDDMAIVRIFIENVNDNQPVFEVYDENLIIEEEKLYNGCLTTIIAYDPDIKDRQADQYIVYSILRPEHKPLIHIDKAGCLMLKKPLDRDPPHGHPVWTIFVIAQDEDGGLNSLRNKVSINITLTDINDNAPFLDMPHPVVWRENQRPGNVTRLQARDYDSDENGPPFIYRFDIFYLPDDYEIFTKFEIRGTDLWAKVDFDREERKSYNIPVTISDHGKPSLTGASILNVIIGDDNDNPMKDGSSSIFVYNYNGESPVIDIGRVYVDDPDDWDLEDKIFSWYDNRAEEGFLLESSTGLITLLPDVKNGNFLLKFTVTEESSRIRRHQVQALVNVTIKEIPNEAVVKSGSVRFLGISAEELVTPLELGNSRKDILQTYLTAIFNVSYENIDIFTVLHSPYQNNSVLDVRFSVHGSSYYAAEKLNTIVSDHSRRIFSRIGAHVLMVNIDECLFEKVHCDKSCTSYLNISSTPYTVYTNASSFVGVRAVVDPQCTCRVVEPIECANGGTPVNTRCECPPGFDGPRCESLSIEFHGDGWAIMPPPEQACDESYLSLEITTYGKDGLVFYWGPMIYSDKLGIRDFMSLELQNGNPVLYIDYGQRTVMLDRSKASSENNQVDGNQVFIADGQPHRIDIWWSKTNIEMKIDGCVQSSCTKLEASFSTSDILNVNSPVQVGGARKNLIDLGEKFEWQYVPTTKGFKGCIRNMTINGNTYNLGVPSLSHNADSGCCTGSVNAVSLGIHVTYFVVILVCCVAILTLIFLLAVVACRCKTHDSYKDVDNVRETCIINCEDQDDGAESDIICNLNMPRAILNQMIDMKINLASPQGREIDQVPNICGFFDGKRERCDKNPDTNPFDDVRHYSYEGEGDSEDSLTSIASCVDDNYLELNYLSNFDTRLRKLVDMYNEEVSSNEEI